MEGDSVLKPLRDTLKLKISRKLRVQGTRKRGQYKIYKTKNCSPAETSEMRSIARDTGASAPMTSSAGNGGGGMVKVMEHLNLSSVKLQAELETTRCHLSATIRKLESKTGSAMTEETVSTMMEKAETLEASVKKMEEEMVHVKRLLQLQLDCLHGIFSNVFRMPLLGAEVSNNISTNQAPESNVNVASASTSATAQDVPEGHIPEYEFTCEDSVNNDEQLKCIFCKRNFLKRKAYNKHCVLKPPKYCAKRRIKIEAMDQGY